MWSLWTIVHLKNFPKFDTNAWILFNLKGGFFYILYSLKEFKYMFKQPFVEGGEKGLMDNE